MKFLGMIYVLLSSLTAFAGVKWENKEPIVQIDIVIPSNELPCRFQEARPKDQIPGYTSTIACLVVLDGSFKGPLGIPKRSALFGTSEKIGSTLLNTDIDRFRSVITFFVAAYESSNVTLNRARAGQYSFRVIYQGPDPH